MRPFKNENLFGIIYLYLFNAFFGYVGNVNFFINKHNFFYKSRAFDTIHSS